MPGTDALLCVEDLQVRLPGLPPDQPILDGVSLTLQAGRTLGIVGESGSGKSMTALAIMGLLPEGARAGGRILLQGRELLALPEREMQTLRGNRVAMVFQEPMTALNPVHTIGNQVAEPLRLHQGLGRRAAMAEACHLLERVGIANAAQRLSAYPHQFSGGQRQRITIAMALACKPDLLIADEPTTALDVILQQQILDLLDGLVEEHRMGMILISHDLAVVSEYSDDVAVMLRGSVVERGATQAVFARPQHAYTRQLLAARLHMLEPHVPSAEEQAQERDAAAGAAAAAVWEAEQGARAVEPGPDVDVEGQP
ncbi:ATP-binding cassette domain-containing protein [Corticibacter populi]|uniref:ATP-binding cassette domain-containing protein n=1 Tax=Corticibacter populi TaxID=1550736 RepID=UPI001F5F0F55|nr:ABC transporter ATP-binding protein [Corticibacter populi]